MRNIRFLISALALAVSPAAFSTPAAADTPPTELQYISLYNNGGYTIKTVTVKWKHAHGTDQKRFTANFGYNEGFCVDLSQVKSSSGEAIPTGAEVWLVAEIEGGDTKSCRKDTAHYYQDNLKNWSLLMGGTTLNNNRCKNSDKVAMSYKTMAGNYSECGAWG